MANNKPASGTRSSPAQISLQHLARPRDDSALLRKDWSPLSDTFPLKTNDQPRGQFAERARDWKAGVDSPPQLVVVLDRDARIIRVDRMAEAWGCGNVDGAPGQSLAAFLAPITDGSTGAWNIDWRDLSQRLRAQEVLDWEIDRRPQGRAWRLSLRPMAGDAGNGSDRAPCYAVLVIEDVTELRSTLDTQLRYAATLEKSIQDETALLWEMNERFQCELRAQRKAKLALLVAEQSYISLVESTLAGICRVERGCIRFCNRRLADILGCSKADLLGRNFIDLIHPEDQGRFLDGLSSLSKHKDLKQPISIRATGKQGNCVWLNLVLSQEDTGEEGSALLNVVDVTSEKNVEISLRESQKQLRTLSCQLIDSQEQERKRVAREVHDGIGQTMGAIKYKIEGMIADAGKGSLQPYCVKLRELVDQVRDAIDESRKIAMDLRPSLLDDLGVSLTVEWFCQEFANTYTGIKVSRRVGIEESALSDDHKLVIYRIIQEAMNNVAKHSRAAAAEVELTDGGDGIALRVRDDGQGFDLDHLANACCARGMGLRSMQERAELTGGSFSVQSVVGAGTDIQVLWSKTARSTS